MNNVNLGYESIDYSNANISSASSFMSSTTNPKIQSPTATNPTAPKTNSFTSTSPFKIFNILKSKNKPDQNAINLQQQQQQQQQQKELQQQKLKQQKTDLKTIGQYIKSFEAIVIKSLRQYTLTTSVNLQTRILELLIQLVFLKVDYCLLDSDKVFIDYVLRQFEYLEQKRSSSEISSNTSECDETGSNHLSRSYLIDLYENFDSESSISDPLCLFDVDTMLNKLFTTIHGPQSSSHGAGSSSNLRPDKNFGSYPSSLYGSSSPILCSQHLRQEEHQRNHILIPKLFDFLILLSHEKKSSVSQISKATSLIRPGSGLLTIPEIMQLCDNLIASENSPHTHAIPALRPLVIDLFLNRANEDTKEIDLHHDVTFNTLLRLIQYPQMWPLLTIAISKYKKDNQEKWKKTSRQVCDALFDSMRTTGSVSSFRLKFSEFNGNELRAIRRYSRSFIPHIESLKQLFVLLNCLAPQVFRPIDFIILSFFETSRPFLTNENMEISNSEMNYWLCIVIVHIYLLLSYTSEEQILIRLHHLMPQIVSSYNESIASSTTTLNQNFKSSSSKSSSSSNVYSSSPSSSSSLSPSPPLSRNHSVENKSSDEGEEKKSNLLPSKKDEEKKVESESESNQRDRSGSVSTSYSNNTSTSTSNSSYNKNNVEYTDNKPPNTNNDGYGYYNDDTELDLNESASFLAKFLLKLIEKPLSYIEKTLKFSSNSYFSANLSANSPSSLLRDFQTNSYRDMNYTQHLIANNLLFLMYIVNSGIYPKISNSISLLINDKTKETGSKYSKFFLMLFLLHSFWNIILN